MILNKVGIIGGGQLAWMLRDAATKLNIKLIVQTPNQDDPAVSIADQVIFAVPQGIEWQWAGMLLNANCVQLIFATFSTGFKNPLGKMPLK